MRRLSPTLLTLALLGTAAPAPAADDPRAIIRRAIQAQGGEAVLGYKAASFLKAKGKVYHDSVPGGISLITDHRDQGDGRMQSVMQVDRGGATVEVRVIVNNRDGWRAVNDTVHEFTAEEKVEASARRHCSRVVDLVPLLRDKGFTLTPLGESKVDGSPALGVKAAYKAQPDHLLYFDRKTGLLIKASSRGLLQNGKQGTREFVFGDYRRLDPGASDRRLLEKAKVAAAGPALLDFVRGHVVPPARRQQVRALIRRLGDDSFEAREKAAADLVARGTAAIPLLRAATRDKDLEVARRARECLAQIASQGKAHVLGAAVRLLAQQPPPGSAAVLLDLLPGADEAVAAEVRATLYHLAHRDAKPVPVLVKALKDKDPVRRAAAAAALGKDGGAYASLPGRRVYLPGLQYALKATLYEDGTKRVELEVLDVQFFNRFDDKLFAKP
jgi:HEAT repeat protein